SADPIVACDHFAQVEPLAELCRQAHVRCRIVIEVNIGLDRVGIRPGRDTNDLAAAMARMPALELVGIMGYEGHLLQIADPLEKRRAIAESIGVLEYCRDSLLKHGHRCDIVSAGGTG